MGQPPQLRVNGTWLSHQYAWGEVKWSTRWPGGDNEVTWAMDPGLATRLPENALVEVMDGHFPLAAGQVFEPPSGVDGQDGTYTAIGLSRVAEGFQALNVAGNATTNIHKAVDPAILRGWAVTRASSVPALILTDSELSERLSALSVLLDAAAVEADLTWHVGPDRALRFSPTPTVPDYLLRPGLVDLAPASADFARTVVVRYVNPDGEYASVFAPAPLGAGAPERPEDVTILGPIPTARAQRIADGLLAQVRSPGWTGALDVQPGDLTTPGGQDADLRRVRAGQMVRLHGLAADAALLGGRTYLDVVLGATGYDTATGLGTITPINAAASGFIANLAATFASKRR
ncbi:hypothetical protein [Nocardioides sp. AX2bis]|uniref:hypothetical protein n=1 Tax=Nocardioides sp. AX2bis TaxID=2653157 RepID=UPI0012F0F0C5|nr:hypothetical protein [Nocardioides sp. AX2bis]VXC43906.1 conserved hypothetical protein [Nocardioides sp. AX2bis]